MKINEATTKLHLSYSKIFFALMAFFVTFKFIFWEEWPRAAFSITLKKKLLKFVLVKLTINWTKCGYYFKLSYSNMGHNVAFGHE